MKCQICGKNVVSGTKVIINNIITCGTVFCKNKVYTSEQKNERKNKIARLKYNNDLEYRENIKKKQREKYKNDAKYKKNIIRYNKKRYKSDPIYRQKQNEWNKQYQRNNPIKIKEINKRYIKKILKLNPNLTEQNRWYWGRLIRLQEDEVSRYNYYNNFDAHHIFPTILYPNFALEEWNGVPLCRNWHIEFHNKYGRNGSKKNYDWDWPGLLFDFIEFKIRETNSIKSIKPLYSTTNNIYYQQDKGEENHEKFRADNINRR